MKAEEIAEARKYVFERVQAGVNFTPKLAQIAVAALDEVERLVKRCQIVEMQLGRLKDAVEYLQECVEAANAEGLRTRLFEAHAANGDGSLSDLYTRKIERGINEATHALWLCDDHDTPPMIQARAALEGPHVKQRYFLIVGSRIKRPMGCCTSSSLADAHSEEPDARFYEISKEEFDRFEDMDYSADVRDWIAESKPYSALGVK